MFDTKVREVGPGAEARRVVEPETRALARGDIQALFRSRTVEAFNLSLGLPAAPGSLPRRTAGEQCEANR
ncbi:MAG: hypothetical protein JWN48_4112 [Myxococcaceae bacterium]|nr:hypothetical protein [Myxococcaceae bacterium]